MRSVVAEASRFESSRWVDRVELGHLRLVGPGATFFGRMRFTGHTRRDATVVAKMSHPPENVLTVHQRLATSGARAVEPFAVGGHLRLAIPQLAEDIAGEPAHMNGGDSDVDAHLFVWRNGRFERDGGLPLPGGEDIEFFTIGDERYLATASLRTGRGPYDLNSQSVVYRWEGGDWTPFSIVRDLRSQTMATHRDRRAALSGAGARCHDRRSGRASPAHARASTPGTVRASSIFKRSTGCGGITGARSRSPATACSGTPIMPERRDSIAGRARHSNPSRTSAITAAARSRSSKRTARRGLRMRRSAATPCSCAGTASGFAPHQSLGGPGGREFELIQTPAGLFLVRMCFIQGTPAAPKPALLSQIFRWNGDNFVTFAEFPTAGGTDAAAFHGGRRTLLGGCQ